MTPCTSFRAAAMLAPLALATLRSHALAHSDAALAQPADAAAIHGVQMASDELPAHVFYDEPGDGALWARGKRWKASFDSAGAVYYAGFGPRQPHNLPHSLSPDLVTLGGEPLAFDRAASPRSRGDRIELDRGAFVEAYELAPESIEQLFVFDSLPRAGNLVVHIPIASELDGVETDAGLEFRGEHGRVTYSRAVAIDARGNRALAPTRLENGAIVIEVAAEFLSTASWPLVIDPIVGGFSLDTTTTDMLAPDISWDPFHQVWLATYSETFSASDLDVVVKMLAADGSTLASGYVDLTGASWTRPRVANNGFAHKFLVVAERSSSSPKAVMGRMCTPNGTLLTMDAQFDIGGGAPGDKMTPDVGGDPSAGTGHFCVVFEHTVASGDSEIGYRLVTPSGTPFAPGPVYFADPTVERNQSPSVSRSNGGTNWLIAWVHEFAFPLSHSISAARVGSSGLLVSAAFSVSGVSNTFSETPCASSPLAGSERCAIAFSRRSLIPIGSPADIFVCVLDGATVLQTVNLMTLESSATQAQDQIEPSVDSDGQHFLVSYSDFDATFAHYKAFVSDLFLADNQLGISQSHIELHPGLGQSQRISQVAAKPALAGESHRLGIIYEIRQNDQDHDISGRLFDVLEGGAASSFCFGDGTGTACPCGNNGGAGRGCANSVNASGAALIASGQASTVDDTLHLQANGMPPSSTCLFFQGTTQDAGAAFGDGLRCVGGTVIRLATHTSPLGASQYPMPGSGEPSISVRGAVPIDGGLRTYQVWYRNSASFCTSSTFNLTSGIAVRWAR